MIPELFQNAISDGLFTDFHISVIDSGGKESQCSDGVHVRSGATLFDVSSLTKALAYLLMWKMFFSRKLLPEDEFSKFIPNIPGLGNRQLLNFLTYTVQDYNFDYNTLRNSSDGNIKKTLLSLGFGSWSKKFCYDNSASAYIGFLLEKFFGTDIESILRDQLFSPGEDKGGLVFHPVYRGLIEPELVVPTKQDLKLRGLVHDPLCFSHQDENVAAAGIFSNAGVIAKIFHQNLCPIINSGFYVKASGNLLERFGIKDYDYALGFDRPYPHSLKDVFIVNPLMFAGWTGCRIFFAQRPRVTICITTNRVFCGDTLESRKAFSVFFWNVVNQVLKDNF